MLILLPIVLGIVLGLPFLFLAWKEVFCVKNNPFPLFEGTEKRFKEIKKYKTRSILMDLN